MDRSEHRTHALPLAVALGAALALAAPLAGCGESGSGSTASSPAAPAANASSAVGSTQPRSATHVAAIAWVSGAPVAKSEYAHWLAVESALGAGSAASHRAVGFLVSGVWLAREAASRGVAVSTAQARARLRTLERESFAQKGSLARYLAHAHETEADLLRRIKAELLEQTIAAQVASGQQGSQRAATLASFQRSFQRRWKSRTTCAAGYVMEDCSEYHGAPESNATSTAVSTGSSGQASSGGASAAGTSRKNSSAAATSGVSANDEVQPTPGGLSISSPAFPLNGAIPAQYTCDGADVSPPLQWQNVPANAAALVLFAIDETASGSASGIRWVVGDIDPSSHGVAAGATPAGGIVGADTQGHAGYGGICPAHGKASTIEFVLYALRKKIALSPGFAPATAESEYGSTGDLLGSSAVTYAVYSRP